MFYTLIKHWFSTNQRCGQGPIYIINDYNDSFFCLCIHFVFTLGGNLKSCYSVAAFTVKTATCLSGHKLSV